MAYNRRLLLNRIKAVCEIYKRENAKGVTTEYIYAHYIRDQFHISRSAFYEYLTVPYEKQIKELDQKEAQEKEHNPTLDLWTEQQSSSLSVKP